MIHIRMAMGQSFDNITIKKAKYVVRVRVTTEYINNCVGDER